MAAQALQIKKAVGALRLLDARTGRNHPLLAELYHRNLNLDDGMVLVYQGRFYHGQDALHMMAMLGSNQGWFNRLTALLFRSATFARLCYPAMRAGRNSLLRLKGVEQIRNLAHQPGEPIFKSIFGSDWNALPPVMKKHYALRAYCQDSITVKGALTVTVTPLVSILARMTGMLVPYGGRDIPVTVTLYSTETSNAFHFNRVFHFPDKGDISFKSKMVPYRNTEMIEFMRFGLGWRTSFSWRDGKVILDHKGYVWRLFGYSVPMPLELIIGTGYAEEIPEGDMTFSMMTHTQHRLLGKTFGYAGRFDVTDVTCTTPS